MRWISSEGGPLLLLPKGIVSAWGGCRKPGDSLSEDADGKTDYDRACEISDYIGILLVGKEEGLVLGEHMQTCWISLGENEGGMLVQWLYANDEASAINHITNVPNHLFRSAGIIFHVSEPILYLFDSAICGKSLKSEDVFVVELQPGPYRVETASYKPNEHTALVIHRLVR